MNDVELYVSVTFDDTIPTVIVDDKDIMRFLRRTATTVISPNSTTEESTAQEESSTAEEWVPAQEESNAVAPYAAPAAGTYSSGKYSGGQSFYVPWDASYLDKFVGYMSKSVGAIVTVALWCSLAYFGIQMLSTVIENFKNRKG